MTSDLRERLRDLSSEMPDLHTPPNLEGRVRRRQVGSIVVAAAAVVVAVAVAAGVAPARRASLVNPVNALKAE